MRILSFITAPRVVDLLLFPGLLGVFIEEFEHIGHGAGDDASMVEAWQFLPLDVKAGGF
jgi:hypothetical protein